MLPSQRNPDASADATGSGNREWRLGELNVLAIIYSFARRDAEWFLPDLAKRDADRATLLAAGDGFVFPAGYEGLGGALLEAMMVHVPFVVSDLAATPDALGNDARFFPAGDRSALTEAMIGANERADDALRIASRDRFIGRFTLEAVGSQMAELYREIVATAS